MTLDFHIHHYILCKVLFLNSEKKINFVMAQYSLVLKMPLNPNQTICCYKRVLVIKKSRIGVFDVRCFKLLLTQLTCGSRYCPEIFYTCRASFCADGLWH